jgi:polygalacturonase
LLLSEVSWRTCDISLPPFSAESYSPKDSDLEQQEQVENIHTAIMQRAVKLCHEIVIPLGLVIRSGPFNLTSNQVLTVDGSLIASSDRRKFPLVAPMLGFGWSNDGACFPKNVTSHKVMPGALRYAPFLGAYHAKNVTIRGTGLIDGSGQEWWDSCRKCHDEGDESYCLIASRPKLVEVQFVDGFSIYGGYTPFRPVNNTAVLTLQNSPFWTVTPSYTQNIYISDLRILAPAKQGNTDGSNLDSCRNAHIANLYISNGDDGIAIKSGLNGFGLNLAIATENVLIENITTYGRGGIAIGSEMSGGIRNVTVRNVRLLGQRGVIFKPSIGRGGFIENVLFQNVQTPNSLLMKMGTDGVPLMPNNDYVPLVSNIRIEKFANVDLHHAFADCSKCNRSTCFNISADTYKNSPWPDPLPSPRFYSCKTTANTMFDGTILLPWPVCVPLDAPVNIRPDYYNWGPTKGVFDSLSSCRQECEHHYYEQIKSQGEQNNKVQDARLS